MAENKTVENKTADIVKYRKQYYKENKGKFVKVYHCDDCDVNLASWNKHHHNKTKKHRINTYKRNIGELDKVVKDLISVLKKENLDV